MRRMHWWHRPGIRWYNPASRTMEDADAPVDDAQGMEMLSGAPNSHEFIAQYRRWRRSYGMVEALIYNGEHFRTLHTGRKTSSSTL